IGNPPPLPGQGKFACNVPLYGVIKTGDRGMFCAYRAAAHGVVKYGLAREHELRAQNRGEDQGFCAPIALPGSNRDIAGIKILCLTPQFSPKRPESGSRCAAKPKGASSCST